MPCAALAQFVVQVLCGAELVDVVEQIRDRAALSGRAHADGDGACVRSVTYRSSSFLGVRDGVDDDVGEVVVDQAVEHFAAGAFAAHHAGGLENAQVLADQWLGDAECADEFVDAPLRTRAVASTMAMRTGAASARSSSPAATSVSCGGTGRRRRGARVRRVSVRPTSS